MRGLRPSLRDAWRLAAPFFNSNERWSARGLLVALIGLSLAVVGVSVVLSYWQRAFYNALQEKDWDAFVSLILFYRHTANGIMPGFCAVATVYILVSISRTWLSQYLRIRWRRWMTERLQREWLTDHAYWRIFLASGTKGAAHGTDNPDQRIADQRLRHHHLVPHSWAAIEPGDVGKLRHHPVDAVRCGASARPGHPRLHGVGGAVICRRRHGPHPSRRAAARRA
jgi:hypothetical protein